jgi:glutathione S-transferase
MINFGSGGLNLGLAFLPIITVLALLLYFGLGIGVGIARVKYRVSPPQITGNEAFERVFRVHQNTLEQIVIFIPTLWIFALTVNNNVAVLLGIIWLIGRVFYAWGYYISAEKRVAGNAVSSLATIVLLLGSGYGSVMFALGIMGTQR